MMDVDDYLRTRIEGAHSRIEKWRGLKESAARLGDARLAEITEKFETANRRYVENVAALLRPDGMSTPHAPLHNPAHVRKCKHYE